MYASRSLYAEQEQGAMYGDQAYYGAGPGTNPVKSRFFGGQRKRMNMVGIFVCLFVPWILFTLLNAVISFEIHYKNPGLCYILEVLGFIAVLACLVLAFSGLQARWRGEGEREPNWFMFLGVTSLIAWVLAVMVGDWNFRSHMQPYYDINNLNTYPSVDPSQMRGQQFMDAGRILFSEGSKLDLTKSMGFKNSDAYCVAPITKGDSPLATYDFWAVGLNCCSGNQAADFHCGEYNNPKASSALRLMSDEQRSFYRLAVQQAESAYNIKSVHPLFLHWMQDPIGEMNNYQDDGLKFYVIGMFAFFVWQFFLVVFATMAFSKMGYY